MSILTRLDKAKTYLTFNWQVLALKLALVCAVLVGTYSWGVHNEREAQLREAASSAATALREAVAEVNTRLPLVVERDKQVNDQISKLKTQQEKFNEEVDKNGSNPSCSLTDTELQYLQELAGNQ